MNYVGANASRCQCQSVPMPVGRRAPARHLTAGYELVETDTTRIPQAPQRLGQPMALTTDSEWIIRLSRPFDVAPEALPRRRPQCLTSNPSDALDTEFTARFTDVFRAIRLHFGRFGYGP